MEKLPSTTDHHHYHVPCQMMYSFISLHRSQSMVFWIPSIHDTLPCIFSHCSAQFLRSLQYTSGIGSGWRSLFILRTVDQTTNNWLSWKFNCYWSRNTASLYEWCWTMQDECIPNSCVREELWRSDISMYVQCTKLQRPHKFPGKYENVRSEHSRNFWMSLGWRR